MEVLHRAPLGAEVPGGVCVLRILQGTFCLQVPRGTPQLFEPGLFYQREPWPAAPHKRIIQ